MTTFYNVVSKKVLPDASSKPIYHKVGVIKVTKQGGWFLQLYAQPNTDFMVFPGHNESLPVINFTEDEA